MSQHPKVEEIITYEVGGAKDAWVCLCGNTPSGDGFYPCTREGKLVEPTPEDWKEELYVCMSCGRIIELDTLKVVGIDREQLRYTGR